MSRHLAIVTDAAAPMSMQTADALEVLRRALGGEADKGPTVNDLWRPYCLAEKGKLRSWRDTETRGAQVLAFFGERHAMELVPLDIDAYRAARMETITRRGGAPTVATINREAATLRRILSFAVANRLLPFNPLARLTLPQEKNVRQVILRETDIQRILRHCSTVLRAVVLVLFDTGMRRMELLGLRRDSVDWEKGIVSLSATDTKNGRARRVPLTKRALEALAAIPERPPSPYVFSTKAGRKQDPHSVYMAFRFAVASAGLKGAGGEAIVLHTLRHSFIANARRQGIPERVCMAISGHLTRSAFDRYASRIEDDEIATAIARLECAALAGGK